MDIQEYLDSKKEIRKEVLELLSSGKTDLTTLTKCINDQKIRDSVDEFRSFLYLISNISNNYHRSSNFFEIIEQILLMFREEFSKYLSNNEIYNIFYLNNRIVLLLLENKIIRMNNYIVHYLTMDDKCHYFINEITPFLSKEKIEDIEKELKNIDRDPSIFEENRRRGENEALVCKIIRNDLIDDFVILTNQINLSLETIIMSSMFETNQFLIENDPSLIEYAAFYGSLQIFNYLRLNNVELRPILWLFSICGRNPEIIHLLEENDVKPPNNSFEYCFEFSIKCHHNEISEYIENKYLKMDELTINESIKTQIIISSNYEYFPENFSDDSTFFDLCRSGHYSLVEEMLKSNVIDVNYIKKINSDGFEKFSTPLIVSISNDFTNIAELLINHPNIDINAIEISTDWTSTNQKTNALLSAVWMDNHRIVELLLKQKNIEINMILPEIKYQQYDCDILEQNALIEAINIGDIDMINILLTNDQTDINAPCLSHDEISFTVYDIERPIFSAIKNGFTNIVKLLLSHPKIDLKSRILYINDEKRLNDSLLGYAIRQGEIEITKLLLKQPQIDVNSICKNTNSSSYLYEEKSPLYIAVEDEKEEIVKLLLSHSKIDVNYQCLQRDNLNSSMKTITVLHKAIETKNKRIINYLLSHPSINVNAYSSFNKETTTVIEREKITTIKYSLKSGDVEILKLLLSKNEIDLNLKSIKMVFSPNSLIKEEKTSIEESIAMKNVDLFKHLFNHFIIKYNPEIDFLKKLSNIEMDENIKEIIIQNIHNIENNIT